MRVACMKAPRGGEGRHSIIRGGRGRRAQCLVVRPFCVESKKGIKKGTGTFNLALLPDLAILSGMPRAARASVGEMCYHVLNRGNARREVFHKDGDYQAFLRAVGQACAEMPMPVLAYCLMPNHFHLAVRPRHDGDLSRWMHWLQNAHVRRYHQHYHSSGHIWQGRFKAFPIQEDAHLLTVLRYIERNPVRAGLATRAERWPWSSGAPLAGGRIPARVPCARPGGTAGGLVGLGQRRGDGRRGGGDPPERGARGAVRGRRLDAGDCGATRPGRRAASARPAPQANGGNAPVNVPVPFSPPISWYAFRGSAPRWEPQ